MAVASPLLAAAEETGRDGRSSEVGRRYGRYLVIAEAGKKHSRRAVLCRCDCGAERIVQMKALKRGTRSCGCLARELTSQRFTKHGAMKPGASYRSQYRAWQKVCERGEVCDAWQVFDVFFADVGARPSGKVLARLRLDQKFGPSNYRWASPSTIRTNVERGEARVTRVAAKRGLFTITDVAAETGLDRSSVGRHLRTLRAAGSVEVIGTVGRARQWEYIPPSANKPTATRVAKSRDFSGGGRSGGTDLPADKDMRVLARQALAGGAKIKRSGDDHFIVTTPSGKPVTISNTPSSRRAVANARADLKREGLAV